MSQATVTGRILGIVSHTPGCPLDKVLQACPDLTWNQVFLAVDRLTRRGQMRLTSVGSGIYTLRLPGG